ncbi:hypothetical protein METP3_03553 [Methanosarcinales archaeon]|nr:hypothetical protein METP3_03553 [Methanosarcinales archaeon]
MRNQDNQKNQEQRKDEEKVAEEMFKVARLWIW